MDKNENKAVYVFSGDEDILKKVKTAYGDRVITDSSYSNLLSLQNENAFLIVIHNDDKEMDLEGHERVRCFNEGLAEQAVGKFYADDFINIGHTDDYMKDIENDLTKWDIYNNLKQDIEEGKVAVQFESFFFGAGSEDMDFYTLLNADTKETVGRVGLGSRTLEFEYENIQFLNSLWDCRENLMFTDEYSKIIPQAFERDDPIIAKFIEKCYGFEDFTREDVLKYVEKAGQKISIEK